MRRIGYEPECICFHCAGLRRDAEEDIRRKVQKKLNWEAFWRGLCFMPLRSIDARMKRFDQLAAKYRSQA